MGSESLLYYNQSVVKEIGWYPEGGPASASLEQEEEEEEEDEDWQVVVVSCSQPSP